MPGLMKIGWPNGAPFILAACAAGMVSCELLRNRGSRDREVPDVLLARLTEDARLRNEEILRQTNDYAVITVKDIDLVIVQASPDMPAMEVAVTNRSKADIFCLFDGRQCATEPRGMAAADLVWRKKSEPTFPTWVAPVIAELSIPAGEARSCTFMIDDYYYFKRPGDYGFEYSFELPVHQPQAVLERHPRTQEPAIREQPRQATRKLLRYEGTFEVRYRGRKL